MAKVVFDGNKEAERMAQFLEESERVLGKSMVIFQCDGRSDESAYVRLKKDMGERLGVIVSVIFAKDKDELEEMIQAANEDETVDGILVQLPILDHVSQISDVSRDEILRMIDEEKDVDGLNPNSGFVPAVVRAVERVIEIFKISEDDEIAVVGEKGSVGVRLIERLKDLGLRTKGFDKGDDLAGLKDFDVIIGATGVTGIISENMVEEGYTGIDLGYPKGDFSLAAVAKATLITPVPGGVGPMTVVSLYENLGDVV